MTSEQEFRQLLHFAWNNSAFYRQLYSGAGIHQEDLPQLRLEELPVVTKAELMGNYDQAITDPRIRIGELSNWVNQDLYPTSLYLNEYIVIRSSAGSATYAHVPYTRQAWQFMTAAVAPYLLPSASAMQRPMRSAFFFKYQGHSASVTNTLMASKTAHEVLHFSFLDPVEEITARLNAFQPERLYGYASTLVWLAKWTLQDKLRIRPGSVVVSGDQLSPHHQIWIKDAWNADIYNLYAACESLYIGIKLPGSSEFELFEHLNLIEVVDGANHSVEPGARGRVLLTNLYNKTLPIIRYDLSDYAVVGKVNLTAKTLVKLEGRAHDCLPLQLADGKSGTLETYELAELELPGIENIQFLSQDINNVEIRYQSRQDMDAQINQVFQGLLVNKSAIMPSVKIQRVEQLHNDLRSSKFRKVITSANRPIELQTLITQEEYAPLAVLPVSPGSSSAFSPLGLDDTLVNRLQMVFDRYGERCAVTDGERSITYRELDQRSRQVAEHLLYMSFDASRPVAVLYDHEIEFVPLILGIVRAGGFYFPLDTSLPIARQQSLFRQAGAKLLLTTRQKQELGNQIAGSTIVASDPNFQPGDLPTQTLPHPAPEDPACLLYTSGTTGIPKGVLLSHQNILHRVQRYCADYDLQPEDRLSLLQSYAVSASIRDIFGALLVGASLALFDPRRQNLGLLAEWLNQNQITVFYAVPGLFRLFLETLSSDSFPSIRLVRLGGEAPRFEDVAGFCQHFLPTSWLANAYAATETDTIAQVFINQATQLPAGRIPAGFPVQGVRLQVQDGGHNPVSDAVGEVTVESNLIASGYWDSSTQRCIPFEKPFPTGDLAYQVPDGRLYLQGRKGLIVKLHGYRIHLGEIEHAVEAVKGVVEAAAVVREAPNGDQALEVYYVLDGTTPVSAAELRLAAASILPGPAVPSNFISLSKLPRLPGGKANRAMLLYSQNIQPVILEEAPVYETDTEQRLAHIWQDILNIQGINRQANFFDLGGDSMALIRVLNRIYDEFGVNLSFSEVFTYPVLADLAHKLSSSAKHKTAGYL